MWKISKPVMAGGGFSVNGSALIHENDREGRERLIRYCARPPFSLERITPQLAPSYISFGKSSPENSGLSNPLSR